MSTLGTRGKLWAGTALAAMSFVAAGCTGPWRANIELRKQNQQLQQTISDLRRQDEGNRQRIEALERSATTLPVLPQERLDQLFTVHGLQFHRLTGGYASAETVGWDDTIKVYVVPLDDQAQAIKAAGQLKVDVFDLADERTPLLASRQFSLAESRAAWYGQAMLYEYVLNIPLTRAPQHSAVSVVVTFKDALTERVVSAARSIELRLPQTAAASRPAAR